MNETEKRAQYFVNIRNSMNGSVNTMLKMELTEIDETKKSVTLHFPLEQWEMNPSGHTHGGIICTMLDMSMGAARTATATPRLHLRFRWQSTSIEAVKPEMR